jgi:hypothetical protein
VGGPDTSEAPDAIKVAPVVSVSAVMTAPVLLTLPTTAPATAIITEPLTYTAYLPLVAAMLVTPDGSCVAGQELLSNGGFEDGSSSAPWVQVKNSTTELISSTQHFSGTYSLWLGGRNTADEEVLQSFVVPSYTEALTLTFKRLLTTQETEAVVYDHFEFVLEN